MLVKPSLADSQLSTLPALPAWETASHPYVLNALLIAHPTSLAALTSNKSFGLTTSETWDRMSTVSSTCRLPAGLLPSVHMHAHTHSPLDFSLEISQIITWANLGGKNERRNKGYSIWEQNQGRHMEGVLGCRTLCQCSPRVPAGIRGKQGACLPFLCSPAAPTVSAPKS